LGSTSLHLTTLVVDKSRYRGLWLWLTACSVLLVCIPPTEFGLLYFVLHEAPLFLLLVLSGLRLALFASVLVLASAWFVWGSASYIDWAVTVAITPFILVAISLLRGVVRSSGIAWLAITAWFVVGCPIVLTILYGTSGSWDVAQISVAYLLISGATSGVLASLVLLILNLSSSFFRLPEPVAALIPRQSLPELLESGLVVIAFFPLILQVSYSAQSYLNQTYEQIGSDAQTRFDLVRRGVEPSAIGVLGIPAESASRPVTYLPASARVIDQGSDYIHWIDAADDIFSSRRYKKLSEYRSGQVTTLSGPINQKGLGLPEAGENAYFYTSEFWRYFQTRFYGLGAWYIGIVATLWLSALLIHRLLGFYLLPLQVLSNRIANFRSGEIEAKDSIEGAPGGAVSAEIAEVSAGFERLSKRVSNDIFEIETINKRVTALVENAPMGILAIDKTSNCTYRNPIVEEFFARDPTAQRRLIDATRGIWSGSGQEPMLQEDFLTSDGKRFLMSAVERLDYADQSDGAWILITDISELVRSQNRVENIARAYEALLRSLPVGVLALDSDWNAVFTNDALLDLLKTDDGLMSLLKTEATKMFASGSFVCEWETRLDSGAKKTLLLVVNERLDDEGSASGLWLIVTDLTEQRQAHAQLIQASKLATLGEMSTGMAHELNQPLSVITLTSRNIRRSLSQLCDAGDPIFSKLEKIDTALGRAASIIDHMRTHGRIAGEEWEDLEVGTVVQSVAEMLGEQLRLKSVALHIEKFEQPVWIRGSGIQMEQVLINLINNARDAILSHSNNGGTVSITHRLHGGNIFLSISDTGGGIPQDVLPHVFEPFFTTKPVGKGTGLGGSISYGIIHDMQGEIWAENTGAGARINIKLPTRSPVIDASSKKSDATAAGSVSGGLSE